MPKDQAAFQRAYRRRQAAKRETTIMLERLLMSLNGAVATAEAAGRVPLGILVPATPLATAQNLIDWLSGQLSLLEVEDKMPASKRKRA
jgi:hypothetical protein